MVSNYSLSFTKEKIEKSTGISLSAQHYLPAYNICPTNRSIIICQEYPNQFRNAYWGLVPHWSKHSRLTGNLYNADKSGISSKTSFRIPIRNKRCVIIADSYYVYNNKGHAFRVLPKDSGIMYLAGLYDDWIGEGVQIKSYAMITNFNNNDIQSLPGKSTPFVLDKQESNFWLDSHQSLKSIVNFINQQDIKSQTLKYYRITDKIKNPAYNTPDIYEEISEEVNLFT